jgi:hypothetical protein
MYYYWVRSVNKSNPTIVSALNAVSGTVGQTAPNIDYALNVLTGANGAQPFYYLPAPEVIDGINLPAGIYIKTAYFRDAAVRYFRAGEAVIDSANIITLNAEKITAGTMHADRIDANTLIGKLASFTTGQFQTIFADKAFFDSAMINNGLQSNNFNGNPATNNPGTQGWYIGRDGKLYLQNAVMSGQINAGSFVGGSFSGGTFTGGTFTGGTLSGQAVNGGTITGALFNAGFIRSPTVLAAPYSTPPGSRVPSISAGAPRAFWDLSITALGLEMMLGNGKIRFYADGRAEFDDVIVSRNNVVAQITCTNSLLGHIVIWDSTAGVGGGSDGVGGAGDGGGDY